jgi:RHS repeat-associated protein
MKAIRFLILGWAFLLANICRGQPTTNSGWLHISETGGTFTNTTLLAEAAQAGTNGSGGGQFYRRDLTEGPSIAEAITPEIQALARGLQNDPTRIYNYVHDHIRHVFYFGSKKGALLTLLEQSGNDFDQDALLVALLRAAGCTNVGYRFALMQIPYDSTNHYDLHHWLGLSLANTNWATTLSYLAYLLPTRNYPVYKYYTNGIIYTYLLAQDMGDSNTIAVPRTLVTLTLGGTNYYLDPAFKISEPVAATNLVTATGLNTNNLLNDAGPITGNYVQNLNEANVRADLLAYTTNLLGFLQANCPNASMDQILGVRQIVSSANTPLSQSLLFSNYTAGGVVPVTNWSNIPTNFMPIFAISFDTTNYAWYTPELQGQRLSLTFDSNGVAQIWMDDSLVLQETNSATNALVNVTLAAYHPYGDWNFTDEVPIYNQDHDQVSNPTPYQRTNATYALIYAFDASENELRHRQQHLEDYRQQGLANTSRQVTSEALNVMGLSWMLQTELTARLAEPQLDVSTTYAHRLGRMGQEGGQGYYVDVYLQLDATTPNSGNSSADFDRQSRDFDVVTYFSSALEYGIIEQMQSSNLLGASTVKILEVASTNAQKIYVANSGNWSAVAGQLSGYDTNYLYNNIIVFGYNLMLPAIATQSVGGWHGSGYALQQQATGISRMAMLIFNGGYSGGFVSSSAATVNPPWIFQYFPSQPQYLTLNSAFVVSPNAGDPVNMADGAFQVSGTDLSLGQAEPRGINFAHYYSSAFRRENPAAMASGWVHNYSFSLEQASGAEAALGESTPQQAAAMLVATCAALNLYGNQPHARNWMVTALIAKWGVDQFIKNSVSITLGKDTIQFVQQPDGSFTPPAHCTMTLTQSNGAYALQERHGRTLNFGTNGLLSTIVDQYGKTLSLTYTNTNLVSTVTDWKSRKLTFNYTGTPTRLTSVTDGTRTVNYGYTANTNGQLDLTSVQDADSNTSTFAYDTNHQVIATINPFSQMVTSNLFDAFGRVTTQYTDGDPNQMWQVFWSGFETAVTDPLGGQTQYFFDDQARLTGFQDALGHESQASYDGQDHVVSIVSPLNETNQLVYDGQNNLIAFYDPLGYSNQFAYDSQNNLTSAIDARGNPSHFGYNTHFQLTAATNGAGNTLSLTYNAADGTLATIADASGSATCGYDSYRQLSSITYTNGLGTNQFINSALGDVATNINPRGFPTVFQYNQRRQLTNAIGPTNLTAQIGIDRVGNIFSTVDPRGSNTIYTWSPTRQLEAITFPPTPPGTPVVTNIYDLRDWLARTLDPLSNRTTNAYDLAGQLLNVTDPLLRSNSFVYDADGRMVAATNGASEFTLQGWSARGDPLQTTNNQLKTIGHGYDGAGNLVLLTNRNGKVWQFVFDAANRLTDTISPRTADIKQVWNNRGLLQSIIMPSTHSNLMIYDARGRLATNTDAVGTQTFVYDANNNLATNSENGEHLVRTFDAYDRVLSYTDANGFLIQYRYDANGNLTSLIYPGGRTVTYTYDGLNRLLTVTDWSNRVTTITRDLDGRVAMINRPNGTVRTNFFDADGEATNVVEATSPNFPIAFWAFQFDNAGREHWEFAAPLPHTNALPSRTFTYDDDNRLLTAGGVSVVNDTDGNLTSGPLTNSPFVTYTYDARNRLTSAGGLTYGYDPGGNRTSITSGTNVTIFVITPDAALPQVLMRIKPGGVTNYYVYGPGLLYETTETASGTTVAYYHFDSRGSTVALTDANGNLTDHVEYSAYGTVTYRVGTNDTPFLYNGRYGVQSDVNGLLYMRARYYNPYLCRFLNPDPSGFAGGLNWYAYAEGNPISEIDPFGLGAKDSGGAIVSWLQSQVDNQFNLFDNVMAQTSYQSALEKPFSAVGAGAMVAVYDAVNILGHAQSTFDDAIGAQPGETAAVLPMLGWEANILRMTSVAPVIADTPIIVGPQQISYGSGISSWAQTLCFSRGNFNPAGNVAVFEYVDEVGNTKYAMAFAQRFVGHAEPLLGGNLQAIGVNKLQITAIYTEFAPCPTCASYLQATFPQAPFFYSFSIDAAGKAAKASTFLQAFP